MHDDATNVYIVENVDIKSDLVRKGIKSKDIMVMGLPYDIECLHPDQITLKRENSGFPKSRPCT